MATILKEKVGIEGFTLSQLVWKKFRAQPIGFIEKVFALNPGLADNEFVPVGTEISFPLDEVGSKPADTKVVRLWDPA